jgi:8-oxo-dGTP pyrophosphatase MutT (NUDIX family)
VQRTAAYAVLLADRRILLTRLSGSGRWTLPGGGIEFGEQPVAAVRREVLEETGLPLDGEQLMGSGDMHSTYRSPTGRLEDFHAVRLYFRGEVPCDVEPVVQEIGGSTDAVAWIPVRELDGLSLTTAVREGMGIVHPEFAASGPGPGRPG